MDYQDFLKTKASKFQAVGFKAKSLNPNLFLFQRAIVDWALQLGKAAVFCGCGLGKSIVSLAWADAIVERTGGKVLIVAPLLATQQTQQEGIKFGVETRATKTGEVLESMELGNQAQFLGVCSSTEMLATYFTHDGGDTSKWRLKGHARQEFWKWVAQWAVTIEKPSDIGYLFD